MSLCDIIVFGEYMNFLIKIFLVFFKIGLFSFGGGYAMMPLFEKEIITQFPHIRKICDELENRISRKHWMIPTYEDIFTGLN